MTASPRSALHRVHLHPLASSPISSISPSPTSASPPARLSPFAFPSDTDQRFVLLIVAVLATSLFISAYFFIRTQHTLASTTAHCVSQRMSKLPAQSNQLFSVQDISSDQAFSASQAAGSAMLGCLTTYERVQTMYMLGGMALILLVACCIYWFLPAWIRWRRGLVALNARDDPELLTYLTELCSEIRLAHLPSFVCDPVNRSICGLAFGRIGRSYVMLSAGLITLFRSDRAGFRAIVLHELAHLRNADVNKTYFAIAIFWAFVLVSLIPLTIINILSGMGASNVLLIIDEMWRVLVASLFIFLILTATLRTREFYADMRVMTWDTSSDALIRILKRVKKPQRRWLQWIRFHPDPDDRLRILARSDSLFHMQIWDSLAIGIATGISAPNISYLMNSLFNALPQVDPGTISTLELLSTAAILATLISVTAGLNVWRTTFVASLQGQKPRNIEVAGFNLGLGFFAGMFLALSANNLLSLMNTLILFVIGFPLSIGLQLCFHWIAMSSIPWIEAMLSKRSPRPFYIIGLLIINVVLTTLFAQFLTFHESIQLAASRTSNQITIVVQGVIDFLIYSLLTLLTSPYVLVAFVCLWMLPFAGWLYRRRGKESVETSWAFLNTSSPQPFTLPWRASLRLRSALISALVSGLVYCGLLLVVRSHWHLQDDMSKLYYVFGSIGLAAFLQAITAGVVVARTKELSVLHGLFAAFVASCIMSISMLSANVLFFRGSIDLAFIWMIFSGMTNTGGALSLFLGLIVSLLAALARRPHQTMRGPAYA